MGASKSCYNINRERKNSEFKPIEYKQKQNYLESIKSTFILKELFSFLNEKIKLEMIIYNKHFQKIFEVDIENYKKVSGRYRVGKRNGKGCEYKLNTKILIFEGEYRNWKRNGKGKEYHSNGKIKYEGEYLNGKKWNGEVFRDNGLKDFEIKNGVKKYNDRSKFEGEYLDGERWNGKVHEYNFNGKLIFESQYLNGRIDGKGKDYDSYGELVFEGEYFNGERWNGSGKEYDANGELIFEGEYLKRKRENGKGKEYDSNSELIFEGEYLKGQRWNGKGKEYDCNDELIFEGEYLYGKKIRKIK